LYGKKGIRYNPNYGKMLYDAGKEIQTDEIILGNKRIRDRMQV
jgi:hypothetical protein